MEAKSLVIPVWGLCPFRSPVEIAEESAVVNPHDANPMRKEPRQTLGPCLFAGCGLYKVTRVENGKVVDGMCGIRFLGEVMNSIAGSLEVLTKIQMQKSAAEGGGAIFGGDGKTAPPM